MVLHNFPKFQCLQSLAPLPTHSPESAGLCALWLARKLVGVAANWQRPGVVARKADENRTGSPDGRDVPIPHPERQVVERCAASDAPIFRAFRPTDLCDRSGIQAGAFASRLTPTGVKRRYSVYFSAEPLS